jgi:CRISPR-associated endonuclease/helicase Cas3
VYRAETGLDSIAQAAGRCNREGHGDRERSMVYVFKAADKTPPSEMRQLAGITEGFLVKHRDDPLSPGAVEDYFRELYWLKSQGRGDDLDTHGILEKFSEGLSDGWFPFETVAKLFKIIKDGMKPVIIPFDEDARALIAELEKAERVSEIARKLQPYLVNVPPKDLDALLRAGSVQPIASYRFENQFCALVKNRDLYRDDIGLLWNNPTFRDIESNMF